MQDEFYCQLIFNSRKIDTYTRDDMVAFLRTICVTKYKVTSDQKICLKLYFKDKIYRLNFELKSGNLNITIAVKEVFPQWYLKPLNELRKYHTSVTYSVADGIRIYNLLEEAIFNI